MGRRSRSQKSRNEERVSVPGKAALQLRLVARHLYTSILCCALRSCTTTALGKASKEDVLGIRTSHQDDTPQSQKNNNTTSHLDSIWTPQNCRLGAGLFHFPLYGLTHASISTGPQTLVLSLSCSSKRYGLPSFHCLR